MSRIGKRIITLPKDVQVETSGGQVRVKGPKGDLTVNLPIGVLAKIDGDHISTVPADQTKERFLSPMLGLTNALINNAVVGVKEGFSKKLELGGVGYRVKKIDTGISMTLGFSHPVEFEIPKGITVEVEDNTKIKISGIDKKLVGLICAKIRKLRKPEPYKGKGIKYSTEVIRRKPGKAGKAAK